MSTVGDVLYLGREGHLDPAFQDVVSGDLHRASELQILQHQMVRNLGEHLLYLMGLKQPATPPSF